MDLKALKRLTTLLRAQGVIQYTDGPFSVTLGDKPARAARGTSRASLEDEATPEQKEVLAAIREANHAMEHARKGRE